MVEAPVAQDHGGYLGMKTSCNANPFGVFRSVCETRAAIDNRGDPLFTSKRLDDYVINYYHGTMMGSLGAGKNPREAVTVAQEFAREHPDYEVRLYENKPDGRKLYDSEG